MPSETSEMTRKLTTKPQPHSPGAPPPEQEHIPCPRCDSTNTKFCYYNNYNFSQPRHFCKSCRRYWTHGGTLRDIPVGGGTRKNAKRSRTTASSVIVGSSTAPDGLPLAATSVLLPLSGSTGTAMQLNGGDGKGSGVGGSVSGSFTSLLSTQGPGFLALGGFGMGIGPGFEEVGFEFGRTVWPFPGVGEAGAGVGGNDGAAAGMSNSWQFETGDNGYGGGGDCFSWPDLAISTPGNGLK